MTGVRALALAGVLLLAPALTHADRARDLADLESPASPETRRRGAQALGRSGTMDDLPALVRALRDSDPGVRAFSEGSMWQIWSRSGDEEVDRLLAIGIEQMTGREPEAALDTFSRIIARRPEFAEGWNKRATLYYLVGDYERSLADCDEVMKRNRYHFGALSGYGMIYLRQGQPEKALDYFEQALAINPNLHQVEEAVQMLRRQVIQKRQNTI